MSELQVANFESWYNLHHNAGVEKTDIFEIIIEDSATERDKRSEKISLDELPSEFFEYFMVEKAS